MRYASLTSRLHGEGSRVWAVHERGYELQAEGRDIILLSIGEPDFAAPAPIVDALVDSIRRGRNHYTPSSGELSIRAAIARHVSRYAKRPIDVAGDGGPSRARRRTGCRTAVEGVDDQRAPGSRARRSTAG